MEKLNQRATEIMDKLTQGLNELGSHIKIDNTGGSFMPVVVEHVGSENWNDQEIDEFSVAHYYQQNGDAMRDPEMIFYKVNGKYYPGYFLQENVLEERSIWREDRKWFKKPKMQADHTYFANLWLNNIKEQQSLA